MRHFIFLLLCLPASVFGQDTLKYETSFLDAENHWVITPMQSDSSHFFGYVFMDGNRGLTCVYWGAFKIAGNGEYKVLFKMPFSLYGGVLNNFRDQKVKLMDSSLTPKLAINPKYLRPILLNRDTTSISARLVAALSYKTLGATFRALKVLQKAYEIFPYSDSIALELATTYNSLDLFDSTQHLLQSRIDAGCCLPLAYQLYFKALMCQQNEDLAMTSLGKALVSCGNAEPLKLCFIDLLTFLANHRDRKIFESWYGLAYGFWPTDAAFRHEIKRIRCSVNRIKHIRLFKQWFA